MYPELFRIGNFPVTTYGLMLAVGMVLALFVASRLAARDGLPRERIYDLRFVDADRRTFGIENFDADRRGKCRYFLARLSAFGRRVLRRTSRRIFRRRFFDSLV